MPVRYTSPSLGASGNSAIKSGQWEVGAVYRWLHADQAYVGHVLQPTDALPFKRPIKININTLVLNFRYAVSSRVSLNLGIPFSSGYENRGQGDSLSHTQRATGMGDVSLVGSMWVLDPVEHGQGNISLGIGVKAPTGKSNSRGTFHLLSGSEQRFLDPSTQVGDGGWGLIGELEAYQHVLHRTTAFVAVSYLANPKAHSDAVFLLPYDGVKAPVAVTDEYSAHAGLNYVVWPKEGLTMSLGGRIDGVPVRDRFGGGDDSFRRPGYVVYLEPSLHWVTGKSRFSSKGNTFTLSVPYSLDRNRKANTIDIAHGKHGAGDFAKYLVFLGYTKRM